MEELSVNSVQFGQTPMAEFTQHMEELNKALGTGEQGDAYGDYNEMTALRPQSLEATLKVVTATLEQLKFWKRIGKKAAYNTVEEFNVIDSYGGNSSPFFVEGGLPNEEDSNYLRQSQYVKFLGTTRVITHPATLVRNTVGDIVALEATNGTTWLLMQLEKALYFADSSLDPLAFDGVITQVKNFVHGKSYENQHVIDMKGQPLDENTLEDIATIISDNFGRERLELHLTNQVSKDLSKILMGTDGRQRVIMNGNASEVMLGAPVGGYRANTGTIEFVNNVFMKPQATVPDKSSKGAPAVPATTGIDTPVVAADASPATNLPAGTYYYFVSAKNSAGESAPVSLGYVAATKGQKVTLTFNRVVSDPVAKSYKVYRGLTSVAANAQFMVEVKDAGSGTTQAIVDDGSEIPGAHTAILMDDDPIQVLTFKQLAPLMRLPLARISASERFMILLYGMIQVYNPRRMVVLKNIGALGLNSNRELFTPSYGAASFGTVHPVAQ
jgi:hypothetical protein